MSVHLQKQVDSLKKMILSLGALVEESLEKATRAVTSRDVRIADKVIESDSTIDQMEIDVEEECLKTLALYQPVAFDLRYVVAVLKINNDLERIGDLAVNIAEQAKFLSQEPPLKEITFDVAAQTKRVRSMLEHSLDALVNMDAELADSVRKTDDEVDVIHRGVYVDVESAIRAHPERVMPLVNMLNLSRHLERIADHAVNIAEDVIYMAKGDILRHKRTHTIPKDKV
ncbi:MAG: phosphate signaling complex protein PhoU [Planctomycetota bacterium]